MHRKHVADFLPLDTEIERTLRNLMKSTSAESKSMANHRERLQSIPEEAETEIPQRKMTMERLLEVFYSRRIFCYETACHRSQQF